MIIVSIDPGRPWVGGEERRWGSSRWSPESWLSAAARELTGRRLVRMVKDPADRAIRLDFGEGRGLAIELEPRRSNLVTLGDQGMIMASARRSKGSVDRLAPGARWIPPPMPPGRFDPFGAEPVSIDAALSPAIVRGEPVVEALRARLAGLGPVGAELVAEEASLTGRSLGSVLRERLDGLMTGTSEILLDRSESERDSAGDRLLPWRPALVTPGRCLVDRGGAIATATAFHESRDAAARLEGRIGALGGILRRELHRVRAAQDRAREDLRSFDDPDALRLKGEALLAGMTRSRRQGEVVWVPDPYDENGRELSIPAPGHLTLPEIADDLFRRYRRSGRGMAAARARTEALALRGGRLEKLLADHERLSDDEGADALEADMREERLPVGLVGATRAAKAVARIARPALLGVRMVTSSDGWTILIGRTGPDNDRLTFKVAAPDDIWLHAAGVSGAHVVIRNPDRQGLVPAKTLSEAATHALWFSDGRSQGVGDVHWTRRKYVRRAKGGSSGRVVLKKFETMRVRAHPPPPEA